MSCSLNIRSSAPAAIGARVLVVGAAALLLALAASCKDTDTGDSGGTCSASAGGPVSGDKDTHCIDSSGKAIKQETNESACKPPADAGHSHDTADAGADVEDYPPTLYGSEGDDDDCKYHLKWTASCVERNKNVTFNVTITKKFDGKPLTDADPELEVFLSDTHPAPNTPQKSNETSPGVYTVGPIKFDSKGKWTVRFHMRDACVELTEDSPHGHAAFFVDVP